MNLTDYDAIMVNSSSGKDSQTALRAVVAQAKRDGFPLDRITVDRARIILMEVVAEPYNRKIHGLWRRPRKKDGRPGSITEYILAQGLDFTPLDQLARKVVLNPKCQKARNGGTHTGRTDRPRSASCWRLQGIAFPRWCSALASRPGSTWRTRELSRLRLRRTFDQGG